jgi:hypothetical protein
LNDCRGCDEKRARIREGKVLEHVRPGETLRGFMLCTRLPGYWHVPAGFGETPREPEPPAKRGPGNRVHPDDLRSSRQREPGEPLEEDVLRHVVDALETLGWEVDNFEQGYRPDACPDCGRPVRASTRVPLGTPDLRVYGVGRNFWIELKRPGGALTDEQREWHDRERQHGGHVYVVRSAEQAVELANLIISEGFPSYQRWRSLTDPRTTSTTEQ